LIRRQRLEELASKGGNRFGEVPEKIIGDDDIVCHDAIVAPCSGRGCIPFLERE
jgi:hypothetical protein